MVVVEHAIAPFRRSAMSGIHSLETLSELSTVSFQCTVINQNRQPMIVGYPAIFGEHKALNVHQAASFFVRLRFGLSASAIHTGA